MTRYIVAAVYEITDEAWEERIQNLIAEYAEGEGEMDRNLAEIVLSDAEYWEDGEPGCRRIDGSVPSIHFEPIELTDLAVEQYTRQLDR